MKKQLLKYFSLIFIMQFLLQEEAFADDFGYQGTIEIEVGETKSISLPLNIYSVAIGGYLPSCSWGLHDNAYNATMVFQQMQNCKVRGDKPGKNIKLVFSGNSTLYDMMWSFTGFYYINVVPKPIPVEKITLNSTSVSLERNETYQLTATVSPNNATNKNVTWSINLENIAEVSSSGLVKAKAVGDATITCTASDGSGVKATCSLKVNPKVVAEINATNFPDDNFRSYLLAQDYGKDGKLTDEEIKNITSIGVYAKNNQYGIIRSLKGIEYFTSLNWLNCVGNQLSSLDLSKCTALKTLYCYNNQLTSLDVSKCTALTTLDCNNNQLTALDVSKLTALTSLECQQNQLTTLNVSNLTALTRLSCGYNQLNALDVSKLTALTSLSCYNNQLTALDVSKLTALTSLSCSDNKLTTLDVSNLTALTSLSCNNNQLTKLDVSKLTALTYLACYNNQLTALDVSNLTALTSLYCNNNLLTTLDVSKLTALTTLSCYNNQLTTLDVSKNTALTSLYCYNNQLTALDVSNLTALTSLSCNNNQLTTLDVSKNKVLTTLSIYKNNIKGTAMDNLISGLPQNTTGEVHRFRVVDQDIASETNICTVTQVAAAKAKGWTPCYYDSTTKKYVDYEGSDAGTGIEALSSPDSLNAPVYSLSGQRLTAPKKGINIIGGKKVVVK